MDRLTYIITARRSKYSKYGCVWKQVPPNKLKAVVDALRAKGAIIDSIYYRR